MKFKLSKKDKDDLFDYMMKINLLCMLRTFPNDRNMDLSSSIFLNNFGKMIEDLHWIFSRFIHGKPISKEIFEYLQKIRIELYDMNMAYDKKLRTNEIKRKAKINFKKKGKVK